MRHDLIFEAEPFVGFTEFDELEQETSEEGVSYEWTEEVNRSNNEYVKWVQRSLNKILSLKLVIDGIAGPKTEAALVQSGASPPPGALGVAPAPPVSASTCATLRKTCEVLNKFDFDRDRVKP